MGDRGNIEIAQPFADESVFLYTHWRGSEVTQILAEALQTERTNDPSYLTRIIFQEMLGDDRSSRSFGISVGRPDDNEYDIPKVFWSEGHLTEGMVEYKDVNYSFDDFIQRFKKEVG